MWRKPQQAAGQAAADSADAAATATTTTAQGAASGGLRERPSAARVGPAAAAADVDVEAAGAVAPGSASAANGGGAIAGNKAANGNGGGGGGGGNGGNSKAGAAPSDAANNALANPPSDSSASLTPYRDISYKEIAKEYSLLGWTAFGGPAAHIGLFEHRLVQRRRWVGPSVFAELFALCQCIPGPASTQLSFAMGTVKRGLRGGLLSGVLFQYPGAFIMTAVGVFAAKLLANPTPWLDGLASGVGAVGIALVAAAAKSMASKQCAAPLLATICALSAVIAYYWPKPYTFPAVILAGGLATLIWSYVKKQAVAGLAVDEEDDASIRSHGLSPLLGAATLALWVAVLIATVVAVAVLPGGGPFLLQLWNVFFRTGSIIYGGGQVVLPMLYTDVVQQTCTEVTAPPAPAPGAPLPPPPPPGAPPPAPPGTTTTTCVDNPDTWVTSRQFYAGLGVVQAMPGPLFNFASYLGAVAAMGRGYNFAAGAALAWFGLFMPGILIIFGILPFWGKFRRWGPYRRALPGLNAAGVGLIVASVFSLSVGALRDSPFPQTALCLGILAFTAVDQLKIFEPAVVIVGGALGVAAWAAGMK
jgi:chromate transporter